MFSHIGMLKTQQLTVVVWEAQSVCVCVCTIVNKLL